MIEVAILYIAIGKYDRFWASFRESCDQFFLPDCNKMYIVFTDSTRIKTSDKVIVSHVRDEGWPGNTLHRFAHFNTQKERLMNCTYCFFFNANTRFLKPVLSEVILPSEAEDQLVGLSWILHTQRSPDTFPYERNPLSEAYIPPGKGSIYFQGGFFGGSSAAFLQLSQTLEGQIKRDESNNYVAVNNDESHLNRYLLDKHPRCLSLVYGRPQEWDTPVDPSIIFAQKERVVGPYFLFRLKQKTWLYVVKSVYGNVKRVSKRLFINRHPTCW